MILWELLWELSRFFWVFLHINHRFTTTKSISPIVSLNVLLTLWEHFWELSVFQILLRKSSLNGNHNGNVHFNLTNSKITLSGIEI